MHKKILLFLKEQTLISLSCVVHKNEPYSFICYYYFNSKENLIYYKSAPTAFHSLALIHNPKISGTILPNKLNKLSVKGIQFQGKVLEENDTKCENASKYYHTCFPLAMAIPGIVRTIQLEEIKMTESVLGMPKNYAWHLHPLLEKT